jgi:hypothetical protein
MSGFSSTNLDVPMLVAGGCGVSDLRKLNVSPADIRLAGFTFEQMSVHLGVDRLREAGFTLPDFQAANYPLRNLAAKFPMQDLVRSNKYSLAELVSYFSPNDLRQLGFTASDFVEQTGCTSATMLRQYGFTDAEVMATGIQTAPAVVPPPQPYQPLNSSSMAVGDTWRNKRTGDAGTFLEVTYSRVDESTARRLLSRPHPQNGCQSNYSYDGSGKRCPRCGRVFILLEKHSSSDGMCGVESGTWICDDAHCGMKKVENYEGYRSIF